MLNESQRDQLSQVLLNVEGEAVRVYLEDSDVFDVTIVSSGRANKGGEVAGTVIWAISTTNPEAFDTGASIHFSPEDIEKIEDLKSGQCLYERGGAET